MSKYDMNKFNREKWNMPIWSKHTPSLIAGIFIAFIVGWLFAIPAAIAALLIYGFVVYRKDVKNRITVFVKPNAAMEAIARREGELKREKERIIYDNSDIVTKL